MGKLGSSLSSGALRPILKRRLQHFLSSLLQRALDFLLITPSIERGSDPAKLSSYLCGALGVGSPGFAGADL